MMAGTEADTAADPMAYSWDAFISHSAQDKEQVAQPLAQKLRAAGLSVWFDLDTIEVSEDLWRKVNEGISKSRFGVVILTASFLEKNLEKKWTIDELNAFLARERADFEIVIPVLHEIARETVMRKLPLLASRRFLDTSVGLDEVAKSIVRVVLAKGANSPAGSLPTVRRRLINLLEGPAGPENVREFLRYHEGIVQKAVGASTDPTIKWMPALGGFSPDVCVSNFFPTRGRRDWHVIVLGPLESDLFPEGIEPLPWINKAVNDLEALRGWLSGHYPEARGLLSDITAEFSGVVVAGRRTGLTPDQSARLEQYNDLLFGIRIRTYDWLIDAS